MKMMASGNKILQSEKNNLKEYPFDKETCIGGWFINPKICDDILEYWDKNKHLQKPGRSGSLSNEGTVQSDIKKSQDILIRADEYAVPFNTYRDEIQRCLDHYILKYNEIMNQKRFTIVEGYNLQHYEVGGGFLKWHYEADGWGTNVYRNLVFMTYLNDVEDGGTEFKYQKLVTPAKKGLTLIWPAYWTHTHKSQISNTNEKFIITGWYSHYGND